MVTFPARRIIDIRVYNKVEPEKECILYHNKDYNEYLTKDYMERFNIKFNLYDMEQKIYVSKEMDYDDKRLEIIANKLKIVRLETVADTKKLVWDYDYNKIWESI